MQPARNLPLSVLCYPYQTLRLVAEDARQLAPEGRKPGSCLLWEMASGMHERVVSAVRGRPGGLPLVVVLPRDSEMPAPEALVRLVEEVRPHAILPYHPSPSAQDVACVLRQPPEDLGAEITDYLRWRGIGVDRETGRLIRRTAELSAELRSISALARALYLSRRALGRRFMARGLPVPSHWLHICRLLRVAIRLQSSEESVLSVGYDLGYPDGFSLSNQMARLTGFRPTEARMYLGWEWLLEAWLRQEADTGGLAPDLTAEFLLSAPSAPPVRPVAAPLRSVAPRKPDPGARRTIGG